MRSVLGWAGQVFAWLVILAMVSLLAVAVVIPRLGGATPYTVLTGSMQPGMPPAPWSSSDRSTLPTSRSGR